MAALALWLLLPASCTVRDAPEPDAQVVGVSAQPLTMSEAQALCAAYPGTNVIVGTDGDDVIDGTNQADCIVGGKGNDRISGGNNDDVIFAGGGSDIVNGGNGKDVIYGAEGNDVLNGENGADTLNGGAGHDTISGGNDNDVISAGDGNDQAAGDNGDDRLFLGSGNDRGIGGSGNDEIHGEDGADVLEGFSGNDRLTGDGCHDRIVRGPGIDDVQGGAGVDACTGTACELPEMVAPACLRDSDCGSGNRCVMPSGMCVAQEVERCEDAVSPPPDAGVCVATASTDVTCDGRDDDCSGTADEDYPRQQLSCGVGACARITLTSCVGGVVLEACVPGTPAASDGTCNGADDDCDGTADEDFPVETTTCGAGACRAQGQRTCSAGSVLNSCIPGAAAGSDGSCDGRDDDCDGTTDEDYAPTSSTCGTGACSAMGSRSCVNGQVVDSCTTGTASLRDTICNALDDDCDGAVDEDYVALPTNCGIGGCAHQGTTSCAAGQVHDSCTAGPPAPDDVSCNAVDDDCDGSVDEDYVAEPTHCGVGACVATGGRQCIGGALTNSCVAGIALPTDEACNGIDDDCDGKADEEYAPIVVDCGVGACAAQGTTVCHEGEVRASCTPGTASSQDDVCNGVDDDCDGNVDEDYATEATTCGVGACAARGATTCEKGSVVDSCRAGIGGADDATCNGADDDCDGTVDEDYATEATACGIGVCARLGSTHCESGAVVDSCEAGGPAASDASCNASDDDCDGALDEDYVPRNISCGEGACVSNGSTSCIDGLEVASCTPGTGSSVDAVCNGIDDDCDGTADEEYASRSTVCGVGACTRGGATSCVNGAVVNSCLPGDPAANDASCDGHDDDCDGTKDEDYARQVTSCGVGACVASGSTACVNGSVTNSCTPRSGATSDAVCDGIDADCDGSADEDYVSSTTTCGIGACVAIGQTRCEAGAIVDGCRPGEPASGDATCDGIDDDCGGLPDEDYEATVTTCGVGACATTGATRCEHGAVQDSCLPGTPTANDPSCDGSDQDCDGAVDEDYVPVDTSCGVGACQATGMRECIHGAVVDNCVPGTPTAVDTSCDGLDDDCDGSVDEDFVPVIETCGSGACAYSTTTVCRFGVLSAVCDPSARPAIVDDDNPCTLETCDPLLGEHPPAPAGTSCDDSTPCTHSDSCDGEGLCAGTSVVVDDGNHCTDEHCIATSASTYRIESTTRANGAACDNGSVCDGLDECRVAGSGSCATLPDGAVSLWPADGHVTDVISGTSASYWGINYDEDLSGGGGQSFRFDTFEHLMLDEQAEGFNHVGPRTIELWLRVLDDQCLTVFHLHHDDSHEQILQVGDGCTESLSDEMVTWTHRDGEVSSVVAYTSTDRTFFDRTHVAVTFDGTTTRIYVNGAQVETTTGEGVDRGQFGGLPDGVSATIGARRAIFWLSEMFWGQMDDIAIYDRALSAAEVAAIHDAPRKCFAPKCVVATPPSDPDDLNSCTIDSCDPVEGVRHEPMPEGSSCTDEDVCSVRETCDAQGACVGERADFCENLGQPCTRDSDCGQDGPAALCVTEAEAGIPGGMCSIACSVGSGTTCPSNALCRSLGDDGLHPPLSLDPAGLPSRVCFPACSGAEDCERETSRCDYDRDVCRLGCRSDADCAAGFICDCGRGRECLTRTSSSFCVPVQGSESDCADARDEDGDRATDCADSDCMGSPQCGEDCTNNQDDDGDDAADCADSECPSQCEVCYAIPGADDFVAGVDDDQDGLADCDDPDCASSFECFEDGFNCADSIDNDRDGLTDCAEPACQAFFEGCDEAQRCFDGTDNDGNGLTDCADPVCGSSDSCTEDNPTHCANGIDDDHDGAMDCLDVGCRNVGACAENDLDACTDGVDNDQDGNVDCMDFDCSEAATGMRLCSEDGVINCHDGIDNDRDGLTDCRDTACSCFERCDDGVDNDGNGFRDCRDIANCGDAPICQEICDDGLDNNGVFGIDCADPYCSGIPGCVELDCEDGVDNEADGTADCGDTDCTHSPACPELCDNGVDDNADRAVDCRDPQCASLYMCLEGAHCDDGIDNDGDNRRDCADSECTGAEACDESLHCRDQIDNDRDSRADCADSECAGAAPCIDEICANMVDDDGDGMFDCADPDCGAFAMCNDAAPELSAVAPALDLTGGTSLYDRMSFVFAGPSPLQYYVAPGTIVQERAALLQGNVRALDGAAIGGVAVRVVGHPEFGQARTTESGAFAMMVNGGGQLALQYELSGYIPVQRTVTVEWSGYAFAEDVVLTPYDPQVTAIDVSGSSTSMRVARGSVSQDDDGTRQATLLVPPGVSAQLVMADGSVQPVATLNVRATELTVGETGLDAMPAHLPANTAYTYAVELSADEALSSGASSVQFSAPLPMYVQNFIGMPLGTGVPVGYYDRARSVWVAAPNGRVIAILSIAGGVASLDVEGDGVAATPAQLAELGITNEELAQLAQLYAAGQSLWRVPIDHFTPWDCNWPYGPPDGARLPPYNGPQSKRADGSRTAKSTGKGKCEEQAYGSSIGCFSRSLGETVPIAGTPFSLHYDSDHVRSLGPAAVRSGYTVQVTGNEVPAVLRRIRLIVEIGGLRRTITLPPTPNQTFTYHLDGLDAANRPIVGTQNADVRLCYEYDAILYPVATEGVASFGRAFGGNEDPPGVSVARGATTVGLCRDWVQPSQVAVDSYNAGTQFGGWDLNVHRVYDPVLQRVQANDGLDQSLVQLGSPTVPTKTFAGRGISCAQTGHTSPGAPGTYFYQIPDCRLIEQPSGDHDMTIDEALSFDVAPDGTLYTLDDGVGGQEFVSELTPDGKSRWFAGRPDTYTIWIPQTRWTPAMQQRLLGGHAVRVGPDNWIYIQRSAPQNLQCGNVIRVTRDGQTVQEVAGIHASCAPNSPDDVPATSSSLMSPRGLAFGADGVLYIGEGHRVRRVGPDGIISTVAGKAGSSASANPDTAQLDFYGPQTHPVRARDFDFGGRIEDIATDGAGQLYIATSRSVFIVRTDGVVQLFAGGIRPSSDPRLDPYDPIHADLFIKRIAVTKGGDVYIMESRRVSLVRGGSLLVLGDGSESRTYADGMNARNALRDPTALAVHPDGRLLVADDFRIVELTASTTPFGRRLVASQDGSELWDFDQNGKHLRTLDGLTGALIHQFVYDRLGFLTSIRDLDGNVTNIRRSFVNGTVDIEPPQGPSTRLSSDAEGRLIEVRDPMGATNRFTYHPGSARLATLHDPGSQLHTFEYDADGALLRDEDDVGTFQALTRTDRPDAFQVARSTAETTTPTLYDQSMTVDGAERRSIRRPDGSTAISDVAANGRQVQTAADGTVTTVDFAPDPRWKMDAQLPARISVKLPSGLERITTQTSTATLSDPRNPLSATTLRTELKVANDPAWVSTYQASTRTLHSVSPEGRSSTSTLDTHGRIRLLEVPGLEPMRLTYDDRGRIASITVGTSTSKRVSVLGYQADNGHLASITGPVAGDQTVITPDAVGRIIDIQRGDGQHIALSRDAAGRTRFVTPPGRTAHEFSYTRQGLIAGYLPPSISGDTHPPATYDYDLERKPTLIRLADGREVAVAYDTATGRTASVSTATSTTAFGYHPSTGQLTLMTRADADGTHLLSHSYDGMLPRLESWGGTPGLASGSVERIWNADFQLDRLRINGADSVDYTYDRDGLLIGAGTLVIQRDAQNGQPTGTTLGTVTTTTVINGFGEVHSFSASHSGSAFYVETVPLRRTDGRIEEQQESFPREGTSRTRRYTYDAAHRLSDVSSGGQVVAHYEYDPNGNRIGHTTNLGTVVGRYDAQDRLTNYCPEDGAGNPQPIAGLPCERYSYNAAGQLTRKTPFVGEPTTYDYDEGGQLRRVELPHDVIDYELDAQGRRVGKRVNGTKRWSLLYLDNLRPIAQLGPDNSVISTFTYATRSHVPDFMVRDGVTYRIVNDHIGSVRFVINTSTGEIAQRMDYDEFGNVLTDTNPGFQPFGFAGGLYDADTGFVRFGFRNYEGLTGRWTAKDPIMFAGSQSNFYSYSFNDPVNYVDPSGLDALLDFANWLEHSGGVDVSNGIHSYGEGLGTAVAHLSAQHGFLGPEAQVYANRLNLILGAGVAAATYVPEKILKPGPGANLIDCTLHSTGALPDSVRKHPGFMGGRLGMGLTVSGVASYIGAGPVGLGVTALSMYGSGIQAAQQGNDVIRGIALGF